MDGGVYVWQGLGNMRDSTQNGWTMSFRGGGGASLCVEVVAAKVEGWA